MKRLVVLTASFALCVPAVASVAVAGATPSSGATPAALAAKSGRTAANTSILCLPKGATNRVAKRKPTSCTTLGPKDSFASAANLSKLTWKSWGQATATATGVELGFHEPPENLKATVTVSAPKANDCGGYSYTKLKVKTKAGTLKQTLPAKCKG